MKKRKRTYTHGFADIERVLDTLDEQYKKAKRDEWLREHKKGGGYAKGDVPKKPQ